MAPFFFHNPFCSPSNHTLSITILADRDKLLIPEHEEMFKKLFKSVVTYEAATAESGDKQFDNVIRVHVDHAEIKCKGDPSKATTDVAEALVKSTTVAHLTKVISTGFAGAAFGGLII